MVVIFIIGLLATVVMINVLPSQDKAMVTKAKADIATLENALEQYRLDNLTYPASGDGLNALVTAPPALAQPERYRRGGYIKKLPADPWGRPYNSIGRASCRERVCQYGWISVVADRIKKIKKYITNNIELASMTTKMR